MYSQLRFIFPADDSDDGDNIDSSESEDEVVGVSRSNPSGSQNNSVRKNSKKSKSKNTRNAPASTKDISIILLKLVEQGKLSELVIFVRYQILLLIRYAECSRMVERKFL